MSQAIIYKETTDFIKVNFKEVKTIDAWRNQFDNVKDEDAFSMPAVFIRMEPSNFIDMGGSSGIQKYDMLLTLMIGFEHYKGTDYGKALELKQRLFKKYHRFEPNTINTVGRFLRNGEEQEVEYDNVLIFGQSYLCQNCFDYDADTKPIIPVTLNQIITPTVVTVIT